MKRTLIFTTLTLLMANLASAETYVRYKSDNGPQHAERRGDMLYPISGDLFGTHTVDSSGISIDSVELMLPTQPEKVFAVGMNFASHLASKSSAPPPIFLKLPSSLALSGKTLKMPKDASNVHFEGELVLIIGRTIRNANEAEATDAIFGFTAGNDLTERSWQGRDLQWIRAKASDDFGPIGGEIVTNVDYNDVLLTTKLNGKVVQQESTQNMIHSPAKVVSHLSHYYTLKPGDLIFMGTPGRTKALAQDDVVEVTVGEYSRVSNAISF